MFMLGCILLITLFFHFFNEFCENRWEGLSNIHENLPIESNIFLFQEMNESGIRQSMFADG